MTAPRPLCAWCGEPLGRRAPEPRGSASIEASWHNRGLGVPTIGWHSDSKDDALNCFLLDPLAKAHHDAAEADIESFLGAVALRGPGRVVRQFTRARRPT